MKDRFFGEYLVSKNIIDKNTLDNILKEQREVNKRIGELCIAKEYLTQKDVENILNIQKITDAPFCEIAKQNNLLTQEQIDEILFIQEINNLHIGELLVKKDILNLKELSELLEEYSIIEKQRNEKIQKIIDKNKDNNIKILIDILKNYFLRKQNVTIKPVEINKNLNKVPIKNLVELKIKNNTEKQSSTSCYYLYISENNCFILNDLKETIKNYFSEKNILTHINIIKQDYKLDKRNNIIFCSSNNIKVILFY